MQTGMMMPCGVNHLYTSETMFGYDKPISSHNYLYLVDGVKMTFVQVRELLPHVPEARLQKRLHTAGYSTTMEELSRAKGSLCARGKREVSKNYKRYLSRLIAAKTISKDKRFAAKAGHADIGDTKPRKSLYTSDGQAALSPFIVGAIKTIQSAYWETLLKKVGQSSAHAKLIGEIFQCKIDDVIKVDEDEGNRYFVTIRRTRENMIKLGVLCKHAKDLLAVGGLTTLSCQRNSGKTSMLNVRLVSCESVACKTKDGSSLARFQIELH